jgi:hypothetical protein
VKPWSRSKFTRYALSDHFLAGSTSPVGTNHNPVSPLIVVVAGRVSVAPDIIGCCGVADCVPELPGVDDVVVVPAGRCAVVPCPLVVVDEDDWAEAAAAPAITMAIAIATRFTIRSAS